MRLKNKIIIFVIIIITNYYNLNSNGDEEIECHTDTYVKNDTITTILTFQNNSKMNIYLKLNQWIIELNHKQDLIQSLGDNVLTNIITYVPFNKSDSIIHGRPNMQSFPDFDLFSKLLLIGKHSTRKIVLKYFNYYKFPEKKKLYVKSHFCYYTEKVLDDYLSLLPSQKDVIIDKNLNFKMDFKDDNDWAIGDPSKSSWDVLALTIKKYTLEKELLDEDRFKMFELHNELKKYEKYDFKKIDE